MPRTGRGDATGPDAVRVPDAEPGREDAFRAKNRRALVVIVLIGLVLAAGGFWFTWWLMGQPPPP